MTVDAIRRLVGIGSPPLGGDLRADRRLHASLLPLLQAKNGFYAFESALLVRQSGSGAGNVAWWNHELTWRNAYPDLPDNLLFFAEDVFGFPFAVSDSGFHSFDPETAELEFVGGTAEEWAGAILDDSDMLTGYQLAHEWQVRHGALAPGYRLAPALPFVLGGEYNTEALRAKPDVELAEFRAEVYTRIKDLPDGAQIRIQLE
ncbi:hypothetical protein [Actinoplanes sp. NPDC049316]|uniref:hypothetical protein n=1 Tax=Actinoplanes sp. NPDC049316 TaxID=3154727 RepID=UPI00343CE10F